MDALACTGKKEGGAPKGGGRKAAASAEPESPATGRKGDGRDAGRAAKIDEGMHAFQRTVLQPDVLAPIEEHGRGLSNGAAVGGPAFCMFSGTRGWRGVLGVDLWHHCCVKPCASDGLRCHAPQPMTTSTWCTTTWARSRNRWAPHCQLYVVTRQQLLNQSAGSSTLLTANHT